MVKTNCNYVKESKAARKKHTKPLNCYYEQLIRLRLMANFKETALSQVIKGGSCELTMCVRYGHDAAEQNDILMMLYPNDDDQDILC